MAGLGAVNLGPGILLVVLALSVGIGAWIGSTKGRTALGGALGILGVIGWLIVALIPARTGRPRNWLE
jgi:hypothetical protein